MNHEWYSSLAMALYGKRFRVKDSPLNWGVMQGYRIHSEIGYFIISGRMIRPDVFDRFWQEVPEEESPENVE